MVVKAKKIKKTLEMYGVIIENVLDLYILSNPFDIYEFRFLTTETELQMYEFMHNSITGGELVLRLGLHRGINSSYVEETLIDGIRDKYEKAGWLTGWADSNDDSHDYYLELSKLGN